MSEHKIQLSWKNPTGNMDYESYDRTHAIAFNGGQSIFSSSTKETFGNEQHANPEELLASALSSCHMLTFLAVASKKKLIVLDYSDDVTAILEKGESGKMQVTKIYLKPRVAFVDSVKISNEDLIKLHETAHRNCFIASSIKSEVVIDPEFN
ncbi:OsmC family protein [Leptospira sp. GIMC2001]|uniref:OsmC family protein n=1 Tax=Leptospira sp. GIMC2001 TaxID=1513297 RepID=UPI00234BCAFE|nr:OsmC family protein [Leptospira sp. GIMC2001]WCL49231.1 OsmC family protein [Leptospira sp. GIMC2001]